MFDNDILHGKNLCIPCKFYIRMATMETSENQDKIVETLRISLLGGRIHFKNLSVIYKDYTISVLEGSLTWGNTGF